MIIDEYKDVKESLIERQHVTRASEDEFMFIDDSSEIESTKATTSAEANRQLLILNDKIFKSLHSSNMNNSLSSIELSNCVKIYFEPLLKKYF